MHRQRAHTDRFELLDARGKIGFADHVDDDRLAELGGHGQAALDGQDVGHAEHGHVVGSGCERLPRLVLAGVHDLQVGENLLLREAPAQFAHGRQSFRVQEGRADLDDIDVGAHVLDECQRGGERDVVERELEFHRRINRRRVASAR